MAIFALTSLYNLYLYGNQRRVNKTWKGMFNFRIIEKGDNYMQNKAIPIGFAKRQGLVKKIQFVT